MAAPAMDAAPVAEQHGEPTSEDHTTAEEVRVAIALNGGVSLAVWMGGCTVELDAARRAHLGPEAPSDEEEHEAPSREIYHALCVAFRRELVIDLMTGSSAGGINGALLAAAVHKERRLHPDYIRDKWISLGDFQQLLHPLRAPSPTSLMNGRSFYEKLLATFGELLPRTDAALPGKIEKILRIPAGQRNALDEHERILAGEVKLDVTTTDVLGEEHRFRDTWGEELIAYEYRQRFRFRTAEDFTPERLATAARSSASFPLAFEPWPVDGALLDLHGPRWLIDGGLLDNAPIRSVLDLIPRRPTSRRVERFVCYVNADPPLAPSFDVGAAANGAGPAAPQLQDVLGYMVNLPRKATFVDHLHAIQRAAGRATAVGEANESLLALDFTSLRHTAQALLPAYRSRRRLMALEEYLTRQPTEVAAADRRIRDAAGELPWIPTTLEPPVNEDEWGWGVGAAARVLYLMLDIIRHALDHLETRGASPVDRAPLVRARGLLHGRLAELEAVHAHVTGDELTGRLVASLVGDVDVKTTLCSLRCRMQDPRCDPAIHGLIRDTARTVYDVRDQLGVACAHEPREASVAGALFGAGAGPDVAFDDDHFAHFLERTLCIEVLRRGFVADDRIDSDQALAFAQITPCAPTLMLTHRPLHPGDEVPDRPDEKLTGTRWAHFAGFYRESWRANDFMWGRLDAAVRIVDMLIDPQRATWVRKQTDVDPVAVLADVLAPDEALAGDGEHDGRKLLIAEALVDADEVPDHDRYREAEWRSEEISRLVGAEPGILRDRLRRDIEEDLFGPHEDGTRRGLLTRALCVRAAQWEILLHELPIVVARSKSDIEAGTATAPLDPVRKPWDEVIKALRTDPPLPQRLGSGDDAEQASTLMIRTASHTALVALAAVRGTSVPLGKALNLPSALLLPIAGLVARKLPYALAVGAAYWAFAVYVAARVVSIGEHPQGSWLNRTLAVLVTYLAVVAIVTVCLVPFWRAVRAPKPGAAVRQGLWLIALLVAAFAPVGLVLADGVSVGDVAGQPMAWEPLSVLLGAALLSVGFPRGIPSIVKRLAMRQRRAPWSGRRALLVTLVPWLLLALWAAGWPLRQAFLEGSDWRAAAAAVAVLAPPVVAVAYIVVSNRRFRERWSPRREQSAEVASSSRQVDRPVTP